MIVCDLCGAEVKDKAQKSMASDYVKEIVDVCNECDYQIAEKIADETDKRKNKLKQEMQDYSKKIADFIKSLKH